MENHDILSNAMQKYYSALKSLDDFGKSGNFFEDVSCLDKFFTEFRNITFVIQKQLQTSENQEQYKSLRDKHLSGETLKWFVGKRNSITKEKPFALKKELFLDIYLPGRTLTIKNDKLLVDFDEGFDSTIETIKDIFLNKLVMVEIFFSSKIIFSEDGSEVDLYPMIKNGLNQMNSFIKELELGCPCDCSVCNKLKQLIDKLFNEVMCKELIFALDYSFHKELNVGAKLEMYASDDSTNYIPFSELRVSLNNPLFEDVKDCLFSIFERFILLHISIFQKQDHEIMPVFMIIYKDKTQQMISFAATVKSSFLRTINEIVNKINFEEVIAVLYCGEYYFYDAKKESELSKLPYEEQRKHAKNEMLIFTIIQKGGRELSLLFDESKIDDMQYVVDTLRKQDFVEDLFDWFSPIKQKLKEQET